MLSTFGNPQKAIAVVLLLSLFSFMPVHAAPADWGESDWYKYIELTITVSLDKFHGGIEQVPAWMRSKTPVKGRLPLLDAYSALSAAGSAVKPGLTVWLQSKMREAVEAEDYDRLNGYQAYYTALTTGDKGPLERIQRRAQAALDGVGAEALILNNLLASVDASGQVEVVPQFTVKGNQKGTLSRIQAKATLTGPETSLGRTVEISLSQPRGYQASQFFLALPRNSPPGRYSVAVLLTDGQGHATQERTASFEYKGLTEDVSVKVAGPLETSVGRPATYFANVRGGTPPYKYHWRSPRGLTPGNKVNLSFSREGTRTLLFEVFDEGKYRETPKTITLKVRVRSALKGIVVGPKRATPGEKLSLSAEVSGGKSPYKVAWITRKGRVEKNTISGVARGKVGESMPFSLVVEDSQDPPQRVTVDHRVLLSQSAIQITSLTVEPATLEPGGKAKVTLNFTGETASGNDNPAAVALWMEASSGLGKGKTKKAQIRMSKGRASTSFVVSEKAKPGPIKVMGRVQYEDLIDTKTIIANIREPVPVEDAGEKDFLGRYVATDPTRTYQQYHCIIVLQPNGEARSKSYNDGKRPSILPAALDSRGWEYLHWSFENGVITLDWTYRGKFSGGGYFRGTAVGNTSDFTMGGRWNNGSPGRMRLKRR